MVKKRGFRVEIAKRLHNVQKYRQGVAFSMLPAQKYTGIV
jgi:hypothetical protein